MRAVARAGLLAGLGVGAAVAAGQAVPTTLPSGPTDTPAASPDAVVSVGVPPIAADPEDTRAAVALLREALVVGPDGRHHRLLRALRFLEDPSLAPLFRTLRENEHAALRVHGLLGTAELASPRGVTTENLVDLERDDQRAEVIGAALDGGLLLNQTLDELLAWPGLADEIKLLLATERVAQGRVVEGSSAHAAMVAALGAPGPTRADAAGLGRRGLAALLLHQIGDARGTRGLIALNNAQVPGRDPVRAVLLETAREHGLSRAGTWAYSIASEPGLPPRLQALALEVAAGFGDARAHRRWGQQVLDTHDNLSRRTRLALSGLRFAAAAEPGVFNLLGVDKDPFVSTVGRAARALAVAAADGLEGQEPGTALRTALAELHATDHPLAHAWLAEFAADPATDRANAVATARQLVTEFRPGFATGRTRRLQAVLGAVETLLQRDPAAAVEEIPAVLVKADPAWTQAVLLGLIRSRTPTAAAIARDLKVPADPEAKALALVLRLRSGGPVGPLLRTTLTRVLRGTTALDDELRVQAAWAYLKRTANTDAISVLPQPGPQRVADTTLPRTRPFAAP